MYLPYSSNSEAADGAVKKREGSQGRPEGDEHDVAEDVRHEEGEQDAQQLHEDHRRVYEVDFVLKEYQVVHVDYCVGHSDILQVLDDSELDASPDHQDKRCLGDHNIITMIAQPWWLT